MPKTWDCFHVFKSILKGLLTRLGFGLLAYLPCIHELRRSYLSKQEGKKYFFVSDFRVLFSILWRTEYQVFTVKLKIHLDTSAGGGSPETSYLLLPIFYSGHSLHLGVQYTCETPKVVIATSPALGWEARGKAAGLWVLWNAMQNSHAYWNSYGEGSHHFLYNFKGSHWFTGHFLRWEMGGNPPGCCLHSP